MTDRQFDIIRKLTEAFSARMIGLPSLSEMASSLNTSKQALYRYFSSKEEIIEAMQEYSQLQIDTLIVELAPARELPLEERIRLLLEKLDKDPCFGMHIALTECSRRQVFDALFPEYSSGAEYNYPLLTAAIMTGGEGGDIKAAASFAVDGIQIAEADSNVEEHVARIFKAHPQNRFYTALSKLAFTKPLTTKALSEELGIAPSTIYSHYSDKKELVSKVLEEERERYLAIEQEATRDIETDPERLLVSLHVTKHFIREGGRLSATLLLYAIRKALPKTEKPVPTAELYTVIAAVYLSGNDTETTIGTLKRGLIRTETI